MSAHNSPLDNIYISLKRAAQLIARDQPGVDPDEIMDLTQARTLRPRV